VYGEVYVLRQVADVLRDFKRVEFRDGHADDVANGDDW
jgi:hypothetical protein